VSSASPAYVAEHLYEHHGLTAAKMADAARAFAAVID